MPYAILLVVFGGYLLVGLGLFRFAGARMGAL